MTLTTTSPGDERLPHADSVQHPSDYEVFDAMPAHHQARTSHENIRDVRDALARFGARPAAEPTEPSPGSTPVLVSSAELLAMARKAAEPSQSGSAGEALSEDEKRKLVVGYFAEGWAIEHALNLLDDYHRAALSRQAPAAPAEALASLRHLYANMLNGAVRDTASAKRIATGLLGPAIEKLERAAPTPAEPVQQDTKGDAS